MEQRQSLSSLPLVAGTETTPRRHHSRGPVLLPGMDSLPLRCHSRALGLLLRALHLLALSRLGSSQRCRRSWQRCRSTGMARRAVTRTRKAAKMAPARNASAKVSDVHCEDAAPVWDVQCNSNAYASCNLVFSGRTQWCHCCCWPRSGLAASSSCHCIAAGSDRKHRKEKKSKRHKTDKKARAADSASESGDSPQVISLNSDSE